MAKSVEYYRRLSHLGVLFLAAGLAVTFALGVRATLVCDRATGQCTIRKSDILGLNRGVSSFPVDSLRGARLGEHAGFTSWSASRHYRVILLTAGGAVDAFNNSSRIERIEPLVAQVNAFVGSSAKSMTVAESTSGTTAIGVALILVGGLMVAVRLIMGGSAAPKP